MAEQSAFRNVLDFFGELGIYDVVLPFLLVFSIVFAILEKTKVLGVEKIDGQEYTRKQINAIVAFVIGFFVIASSELVEIIFTISSHVVILLLLIIFFLLLVGSIMKEGEVALEGGWNKTFMWIAFIGILLIGANAIPFGGTSFLNYVFSLVSQNYSSAAVGSVILLIIVLIAIGFIIRDPKPRMKDDS